MPAGQRRAHAPRAALLPLTHGRFECRETSVELVEEVRRQPAREEPFLVRGRAAAMPFALAMGALQSGLNSILSGQNTVLLGRNGDADA